MYTCPYCSEYADSFRETPEKSSYVRVLHASPGAPAVDIYINNAPILKKIAYKQFSNYLPILPGTYNIKVFITGTETNPIINSNLFVPGLSILTLAAIGKAPEITLLPIADKSNVPLSPGKSQIRFVHLSPDAPAVDVAIQNSGIIFKNVSYKQIEEYVSINPGVYSLQVKASKIDKTVLTNPKVIIRPKRYYTIYAVGLLSGNPPLQVLLPLDGNTYLEV